MTRICDICGQPVGAKGYQFSPPSVLIDNVGKEPVDSSMTDVCAACATKQVDILAKLIGKADGK